MSETGIWSAELPSSAGEIETHVPISFPIPLAEGNGQTSSAFFFTAEEGGKKNSPTAAIGHREPLTPSPNPRRRGPSASSNSSEKEAEFLFFGAPGAPIADGYTPAGTYMFMKRAHRQCRPLLPVPGQ